MNESTSLRCPQCTSELSLLSNSSSEPEGLRRDAYCTNCEIRFAVHKHGVVKQAQLAKPDGSEFVWYENVGLKSENKELQAQLSALREPTDYMIQVGAEITRGTGFNVRQAFLAMLAASTEPQADVMEDIRRALTATTKGKT